MKPALSITGLPLRLAAAGLMLATVAWAPGAIDRTGRTENTGVARDNAVVHLFDQNQKGAVTPELPWFLKPSDPQKEQQKRLQMMHTAQNQLKFTENRGQATDQYGKKRSDVLYYGGTSDMKLYFTNNSIGFVFNAESPVRPYDKLGNVVADRPMTKKQIMTMDLLGANKGVEVVGSNQAEGVGHYMRGPQESWIMGIASYHQLTYRNIYDKIDMVVDTRGNSIKYDFVVRPGGDPSQIRFQYKGAKSVNVNDRGSLVVNSPVGTIEEEKPYSYQGENQEVANGYQIDKSGVVSFNVGSYDASKTLTIDPIVIYSTYWGGNGDDAFEDVELRGDGWVAVGYSSSTSIPTATAIPIAAITHGTRGSQDGLVAKYSATNQLVWYAFIGGTQNDLVNSVELDGTGATGTGIGEAGAYIMGTTNSNNVAVGLGGHGFPTAGTVVQPAMTGTSSHAFVARLDYGTGALRWISYKGGSGGGTTGERLTVRWYTATVAGVTSTTRIVAGTGKTASTALPTTDGGAGVLQSTNPGGTSDAYLIYWTESATTLGTVAETWATYLGGSSVDEGSGAELDANRNLYVAGHTQSLGPTQVGGGTIAFPVAGGAGVKVTHSVSANSQFDGYEGKFSPTGARTCLGFFGNSGDDYVKDSGLDNAANILYLTGMTLSSSFDIGGTGLGQDGLAAGCGQPARAGAADAYMAKFDENCILRCATFHGGSEEDIGMDLDVLENSGALGGKTTIIVAGYTFSANMPVSPAANQQGSIALPLPPSGGAYTAPVSGNSSDFFMICYSPDCCRLWSSYWGGSRSDEAHGVSAFTTGAGIDRMVVCGITFSVSGGGETAYPVSNATGSNYFQGSMTVNGEPDGALLAFEFFRDEKLSIDLTSFGASVDQRNVNLKWRTASEDHNAGFEVQRAELLTPYDKVTFKAIGNYLTNTDLIGLGSSPVGKEYKYVDNDPSLVAGRTYIYQLVDIANDGLRTGHPSVSVQLDAGTITPVYEFKVDPVRPNPTTGSMQLAFSLREDSKVTVEIYGVDGKKIAVAVDGENFNAGNHVRALDVKNLVPGVYTAVVSTSNYNYVRTRQFVVVK